MLWIVQKNLDNENKRDQLLCALERLDIDYHLVDVQNNTIIPEIEGLENTQPIITNGSIMLSNIANARGWTPGSMINDNYDYQVWSKPYKDMLLNKDAVISSLHNAVVTSDKMFVRPLLDNKTFNGRVFSRDEFLEFQRKSINGNKNHPRANIEILLAPTKKIGQEHRHYIVDGEIITSSRYKLAGTPNFKEGADDYVLDVVKKAISLWTPARAFVLDTFIAGDEIGIVEIGSICHAGLYEANIIKLVHALDSMPISRKNQLRK